MISIIIPTLNEEENIMKLIPYLHQCCKGFDTEIIIVDCGSSDKTISLAKSLPVKIITTAKGRAIQMNSGAVVAKGDILYFVHADSIPPPSFCKDIIAAIGGGYKLGRYRTYFGSKKWIFKLNAFFTRFDWFMCYGGDQTFFIEKILFNTIKGYNESMLIMEEYDLVARAKEIAKYKIFSKAAIISVRKYEKNSWYKVQRANYKTVQLFKKGMPQNQLLAQYKEALKEIK